MRARRRRPLAPFRIAHLAVVLDASIVAVAPSAIGAALDLARDDLPRVAGSPPAARSGAV